MSEPSPSRPGIRADELADGSAEHDDYRSIMVQALADRLAEAFAEYFHETARREWYETGERLSNEGLIAESYRGIRPAFPGLPGLPRPFGEADALRPARGREVGIELTDSSRGSGASVSGLFDIGARYFSVGRLARDQVENYAVRKGAPLAEIERWLAQPGVRPRLTRDSAGATENRQGRRCPSLSSARRLRAAFLHAHDSEERRRKRCREREWCPSPGPLPPLEPAAAGTPPPPTTEGARSFYRVRRRPAQAFAKVSQWLVVAVLVAARPSRSGSLYFDHSVAEIRATDPEVIAAAPTLAEIAGADEPAVAVVIGYDQTHGAARGRSDTVMLVRVDPGEKAVTLLSFPRDLLVSHPGCEGYPPWTGRINEAYVYCTAAERCRP